MSADIHLDFTVDDIVVRRVSSGTDNGSHVEVFFLGNNGNQISVKAAVRPWVARRFIRACEKARNGWLQVPATEIERGLA